MNTRSASSSSIGLLVVIASVALAGCDDKAKSGGTAASASASGSAAAVAPSAASAKPADTTAKPADTAKPAEDIEFDLSSADKKWAGWVAKGPADAKVMADGVAGARIAAKGPNILERKKGGDNGFDLAFAWGKDDLKGLKTNLQKGAEKPIGDIKITHTFTKEEPGLMEWTTETGDSKTYNFVMHMNVEKKDITCKNNMMMGAGNEAEHKHMMAACKTLAKKAK